MSDVEKILREMCNSEYWRNVIERRHLVAAINEMGRLRNRIEQLESELARRRQSELADLHDMQRTFGECIPGVTCPPFT